MAILISAAVVLKAATVRRMDTAELVSRAQLIVQGTVIATSVAYVAAYVQLRGGRAGSCCYSVSRGLLL